MEKLSLRRLRYAVRTGAKGQYIKALGQRVKNPESYIIKGLPSSATAAMKKLHLEPIGATRRYKKYFTDKGKVWKGWGVMQTRAPSFGSTRRTIHVDFDVNPIISTKALKAIAASAVGLGGLGAIGAKILKNRKKEEKGTA